MRSRAERGAPTRYDEQIDTVRQRVIVEGEINSKDGEGKEVVVDTGVGVPGAAGPSNKDEGFCGFRKIGGLIGREGDYLTIARERQATGR